MATELIFPGNLVRGGFSVSHGVLSERASSLLRSRLFADFSNDEIQEVAALATDRSFERNAVLFSQGEQAKELFLLNSGSLKLTQLSYNGSEVILWLNQSGDAVGVAGIVSHGYHTSSARVVLPCTALAWNCAKLLRSSQIGTKIRRNINLILTDQLVELEERFREVATEKVARRVALALLRIVDQRAGNPTKPVEVYLSREEIAQLTGTTLFAISRLVSQWHEEGICLPRREAVVILRRDLLAVAAGKDA